jgi:hypothetical protein
MTSTIRAANDVERIARLEERVSALERALVRIAPSVASELTRTQPMNTLEPSREATLSDRMNFTSSFAALDAALQEATRAEDGAAPSVPTFDGPVPIDPSLIDRAFERPPPEQLHVVSDLEAYDKIVRLLVATWQTREALDYLKKLIVDDRGNRAGFPPGVMSELLMLAGVLEAKMPGDDAWQANARVI